ncbi:hypothetical protein HNQ65_005095 [Prosthecobacter vanneervenii]|uniref:Uncharacterized protein n=1 Tax=Prosthecobacter vanneervenii TaxID=48466 RepID=A0A7W7YG42_9BACT|nr:hypothetical protein [Prosthecobacter vanneervenii]
MQERVMLEQNEEQTVSDCERRLSFLNGIESARDSLLQERKGGECIHSQTHGTPGSESVDDTA